MKLAALIVKAKELTSGNAFVNRRAKRIGLSTRRSIQAQTDSFRRSINRNIDRSRYTNVLNSRFTRRRMLKGLATAAASLALASIIPFDFAQAQQITGLVSPSLKYAVTITDLVNTPLVANTIVELTANNRRGFFHPLFTNQSANVTLDTSQGIYVAPAADTSGASGAWVRIYSGPVYARWFGATGDGVTDDFTAISGAYAVSNQVSFDKAGTFVVGSNLTLGTSTVLIFENGRISPNTGIVVALNNSSTIVATRQQIFSGVGTITNVGIGYPEWWGATKSTSVSSFTAFNACLAALKSNGVMSLDAGFYAMPGTTPLTCSNGQVILGAGHAATVVRITTAATFFALWTTIAGGELHDLTIENQTATPTSGTLIDFQLNTAAKAIVSRIVVNNCWNFCRFLGSNTTHINDMRIEEIRVHGVYNEGLRLQWAENVWVSEGIIDGLNTTTAGAMFVWQDAAQAIFAERMLFSNAGTSGLIVSNSGASISRGNDARWNKLTACVFDDCQTGADCNYMTSCEFTNCWFNSCGRISSGYAAGYGLRLRTTVSNRFVQCQFSNNGDHGCRAEATSTLFSFEECEFLGDNVNADGSSGLWIQAACSHWTVDNCTFGNGADWSGTEAIGILINTGASDYYTVTNSYFNSVATAITDNGTGTHKNVVMNSTATNNWSF